MNAYREQKPALIFLSYIAISLIAGCAQSNNQSQTKTVSGNAGGIRNIHFEDVLNADVSISHPEDCPPGAKPVRIVSGSVQYGDLDGDGLEEAVIDAFSCDSGTAGADIFAVFKMTKTGQLIQMPFNENGQLRIAKTAIPKGMDIAGHIYHRIRNGKLIELMPFYRNSDPNCCPSTGKRFEISFRWDGNMFVQENTKIVPDSSE